MLLKLFIDTHMNPTDIVVFPNTLLFHVINFKINFSLEIDKSQC